MIEDGLRTMCMWLCKFIYSLIAWLYELFMNLARVELLTSDNIKPIYERVTMILAIIMVFYVTFEFVKYVMQPETLTDKEKGVQKIVPKMIIVVVLIAFVPTIFSYAYKLQGIIIDNQVFSKVILGKQNVNSSQFGRSFSASLFQRFYTANTNLDDLGDCEGIPCEQLVSHNLSELASKGETNHFTLGLNDKEKRSVSVQGTTENIEEYKIDFNPILAVGIGAFVVYMLVLYCIEVGVRVAQLAYLQVIAPIPIIGYLSPKKDGIFQKWGRQCLTTYLDLFVRIAIIYFILLVCQIIGDALNDGTLLEGLGEVSPLMETFIYVALIAGLLIFAKKAPKMLEELFPKMGAASGNFGLSGENAKMVARGAGMALGASRLIGGAASSALRTHARNKRNGQKPIWTKEGQQQFNERMSNRINAMAARSNLKDAEAEQKRNEASRQRFQKRFDKAKNEVHETAKTKKEAQAELEKAKLSGDSAKIRAAQAKYDAAKTANDAAKTKAKTMLEQDATFRNMKERNDKTKEARDNLNRAEERLKQAEKSGTEEEKTAAKTELSKARKEFQSINPEAFAAEEKIKKEIAAIKDYSTANDKLQEAEENLKLAEQSGDVDAIRKARETYEAAKEKKESLETDYNDAKKTIEESYKAPAYTYKSQTEKEQQADQEKIDKMRQDVEELESKVAQGDNERHRSVIASAATGGIVGGLTGAYHGSKATKLTDIPKQIKAGVAADVKRQQEIEKYYDNGGTGFIDRTVTQVLKNQGFQTAYQATQYDIQKLEKQIKESEATIANETSIKSTVDGAEDRLKDKIEESKLTLTEGAKIKTGLTGEDAFVKFTPGQTIADVYRDYKGKASTARSEADALAQEKSRLESQGKTNTPEYSQVSARTTAASKRAADLEFAVTQIQKNGARHQFTEILKHPNPEGNSEFDQVAVQKIRDAQRAIEVANHDPKAIEDLRRNLSPEDFAAFMSGKFVDFDQFDRVKTAAINASNVHTRDNMKRKDEKRMKETSFATMAQKADNDFTGGSGK